MKVGIIASKLDAAGMNIAGKLLSNFAFKPTEERFQEYRIYSRENGGDTFNLLMINESQLEADFLGDWDMDVLVFASKHSAESGKPALTTHAIGNTGKAEYGGKPGIVVPGIPHVLRDYYVYLNLQVEARKLDYEVSLEATHHGPCVKTPSVFIELGSTQSQWNHNAPAEVIAQTILFRTRINGIAKVALGIGGNHYCATFNKVMKTHPYAFNHIIPQHSLEQLDENLLHELLRSSTHPVEEILVDEKGLGSEKNRVMALLDGCKIPVKGARKL